MNLAQLRDLYMDQGLSYENASARVQPATRTSSTSITSSA